MLCLEKCPIAKELTKTWQSLESLVWLALQGENPLITVSRGRELLGYKTMEDMREWMDIYGETHK